MLKHNNIRILFIILLVVLVVVGLFYPLSWFVYAIPVVTWVAIMAWGSYNISSGFYLTASCRGKNFHPEVALTFDDGPHPFTTQHILDVLQLNGVPAAFFCIGNLMESHPHLVRRMIDEGHIVGNHSWSHHFFFDLFSFKRMVAELIDTTETGRNILGKRMRFFRPPYGVTTPVVARAIRASALYPIGWSLRSYDTTARDPAVLARDIGNRVRSGDIVLLHDTMQVTAEALQRIIDEIKNKGLTPVRLDHLLKEEAYA